MGPQSLQIGHMGSCGDREPCGEQWLSGGGRPTLSRGRRLPLPGPKAGAEHPSRHGPLLSWKAQILSSVFSGTMNMFSVWWAALSMLGKISRQAVWVGKGSDSHCEDL